MTRFGAAGGENVAIFPRQNIKKHSRLSAIPKENLITREDQIFSESTEKRRRKQTVTNGDMNKLARVWPYSATLSK